MRRSDALLEATCPATLTTMAPRRSALNPRVANGLRVRLRRVVNVPTLPLYA